MFEFIRCIMKAEPECSSIGNMSGYELDEHRSIPCRSSDFAFRYRVQTDSGDRPTANLYAFSAGLMRSENREVRRTCEALPPFALTSS
jgi:hypothetical protein